MEAKLFIFAAVAISEVFSACSPRRTAFKDFHRRPKRSKPFAVEVFAKMCPGLHEFYYSWKVEELSEPKKIVQTSFVSSISIDGYKYNSKTCFVNDYLITVSVSHYPDMSSANTIESEFRFVPDFMHIEIEGGIRRALSLGENLIVDARKLSRDPSYPPNEDDFEGNEVKWTVEPEIKGFNFTNNLVQNISSDLLKLGDVYTFTVEIIRTKIPGFEDTENSTQVVTVVPKYFPEVNVRCIRNCINPLNWESTVFQAECSKNCKNLLYKWSIEPDVPKNRITLGDGHDKIIIQEYSFQEGDQIFVSFLFGSISYTQSLTYVTGIIKGTCTINPERGISGVTHFQISCKDFYSPFGLSRCMIFLQYGEDVNDLVLLDEYSYKEETVMYLPPSDPAYVTITVEDHAYLQADVTLKVVVEDFQIKKNIAPLPGVKILVLSRDFTSVTSYSLEGYNNEVVQMTCCLLAAIKTFKIDDATAMDLHKHMVEAIMRSSPVRLASAYQRVLVLCKLQKYKLKTDTVTARLVGRGLLHNAISVHILYNHKQTSNLPQFYVTAVFFFSLMLTSELLEENLEILDVLNYEIPPHDYDSYDEFVSQKIQIREDYRHMLNDLMIALHTNGITILFKAIPGENPYVYYTPSISVTMQRILLSKIENNELNLKFPQISKTSLILPSKLIQDLQKEYIFIDYQFGIFLHNPFWWHSTASEHCTQVAFFDLFSNCTKIRKYNVPFELRLELSSVPKAEITGIISQEVLAIYKVEFESNETLVTEFFHGGKHPNDYLVTWSHCVCTEADFSSERAKLITKNLREIHRLIRVENKGNLTHINLCIKKLTPMLSYRFRMTAYSCQNWDLQDKEWKKEGCKVIDPSPSMTDTITCHCYHSSLFVGKASKPVTTHVTNRNIEVTIGFVKNYLTVFVIVGLLLLWLVSLALAHYKDKSMNKGNKIYKLDDNVPGDSNPYLIVVFTGIFYDAHTTADVVIRLVGDQSKSRNHLLKCTGVTSFKRNSQDWFILYTPRYLGKLKKIQLWHNCRGSYPHWYCDRIIVQDLKTGEQYCFTVKKWFSVIWGTGRIYREIPVAKASVDIHHGLFMTQLERDLKDKHIWLSILTRDFQSNFSSKERVSTGFCFLFLSMLANALLLSVPHDAPSDSIDPQGSFDVGAKNIIIFIESWLVATPTVAIHDFVCIVVVYCPEPIMFTTPRRLDQF